MEVPVRRILQGANPSDVAAPDAMRNPASIGWFVDFAARRPGRPS
jgi:acetoacetyl-CoA synthetase